MTSIISQLHFTNGSSITTKVSDNVKEKKRAVFMGNIICNQLFHELVRDSDNFEHKFITANYCSAQSVNYIHRTKYRMRTKREKNNLKDKKVFYPNRRKSLK